MITETLAGQERLRIGDSITLDGAASAGPTAFAIVGIVSGDGSVPDAAGRLVIVPLASAQALFDVTGVTRVDLGTQPGVTANDLVGNLEDTITTEPYLLEKTSDTADSLRAEMADFSGTLLLVAAVVLFAGAFLIFNTLSMTVAERSRDVGLLRAAGTTRSQVMGFVLLQAFALGSAGIGRRSDRRRSAWPRSTLSWVDAHGPHRPRRAGHLARLDRAGPGHRHPDDAGRLAGAGLAGRSNPTGRGASARSQGRAGRRRPAALAGPRLRRPGRGGAGHLADQFVGRRRIDRRVERRDARLRVRWDRWSCTA